MNSAAASSNAIPPAVGEVIEGFLTHFYMWELVKTERWGKNVYITFKTRIFNDLHVKQIQKLARSHDFQLVGFGALPLDAGELLVTFVLNPRRG